MSLVRDMLPLPATLLCRRHADCRSGSQASLQARASLSKTVLHLGGAAHTTVTARHHYGTTVWLVLITNFSWLVSPDVSQGHRCPEPFQPKADTQ
jgi:hypothetical protein